MTYEFSIQIGQKVSQDYFSLTAADRSSGGEAKQAFNINAPILPCYGLCSNN